MKHLFPIFLFLILTAACVQPVDIPPAPQEVFVKCILMNDTVQTVELYYSGAIGADRFEPVENAVVRIEDSAHDSYNFSYAGNGHYLSDFRPHSGRTYTLDIRIPDRERITASVRFPKDMRVGSRFFPPIEAVDSASEFSSRLIPWDWSPSLIFDYLDWGVFKDITDHSLNSFIYSYMPGIIYLLETNYPEALYVLGFNEKDGQIRRAEHLATTHLFADPTNAGSKTYSSGDPMIQADGDIRSYYEYCMASHYDGLPLHDGYLRIVSPAIYENGLDSLHVCGPRPKRGISFSNWSEYETTTFGSLPLKLNASSYFAVVGDISYNYWFEDERAERSSLYFCAVSESYDRYLQDCRSMSAEKSGDLLGSLYSDASRIYSNIEGGYGIFGAMYVLRHDCDLEQFPEGTEYPRGEVGIDISGNPIILPPALSKRDLSFPYNPYPAPLPSL